MHAALVSSYAAALGVPPQVEPIAASKRLKPGWRAPRRRDEPMPADRSAPSGADIDAALSGAWAGAMEELERAVARDVDAAVRRRREAERGSGDGGGGELVPGAVRRVSYDAYVRRFGEHVGRMLAAQRRASRLPDVATSFADPAYEYRGAHGDEVLQMMEATARDFPDPPTPLQWKVIRSSLCAMAALIFGEECASVVRALPPLTLCQVLDRPRFRPRAPRLDRLFRRAVGADASKIWQDDRARLHCHPRHV